MFSASQTEHEGSVCIKYVENVSGRNYEANKVECEFDVHNCFRQLLKYHTLHEASLVREVVMTSRM